MTNEEMERAIALLTARVNRVVREFAHMKPVTTVDPAVGAIDATIAIIDRMNVSLAGSTATQREEARTFLQRVRLSLGGN